MRPSIALESRAWRGHMPVWAGLAALVALGWIHLARMNAGMPAAMEGMARPAMGAAAPGIAELLLAFLMWGVMMVAMMLPTAVPAVALYVRLAGRRDPARSPAVPAALFVGGYLAAWTGYAAAAAVGQWALARAALLTPMLESASVVLSASILLAAGIFQFTPLKEACLAKCRAPLAFFLAEWRDGKAGAVLLGLRHGSYCVACCWALMALMFVVGAMNLLWMAALTAFLLGEKIAPARWNLSRVSGAALIAWAGWIAAAPWF